MIMAAANAAESERAEKFLKCFINIDIVLSNTVRTTGPSQ
jgi:hypothetical protein